MRLYVVSSGEKGSGGETYEWYVNYVCSSKEIAMERAKMVKSEFGLDVVVVVESFLLDAESEDSSAFVMQ
jgi:hypothetical protein